MQSTLRSVLTALVISAAATLTSHPVLAAGVIVNVPFSFTAMGKKLPAGAYQVRLEQMNQVLHLTSGKGRANMVWLVGPGEPNPNDRRVVMRFDRSGVSYALRDIQYGPSVTSRLDKNAPTEPPTEILGQ